ncbi:MAG: dTDP-4-dehydrorhamnose reductase [Patiriisocius sp.]|uniref:dTDP-4-dehydrorhamnose reductase n=1 Tax=Patiriisocius sp. TaxID=2822396 RepID=UPI003EF99ABE
MKKVLIFGGNGQLGQALKKVVSNNIVDVFEFYFFGSKEADVGNLNSLEIQFLKFQPEYIINCAAYTAVDDAEDNEVLATKINVEGAFNLALLSKKYGSCLILISTDFVFDGTISKPLKETDPTNPLGIYGKTKLLGEQAIENSGCSYIIVRTSWLYSEFQQNFLKSMLHLATTRDSLNVVADQVGTPTYAVDLAVCLIEIVLQETKGNHIFHYSNEGVASWYDFAWEIFNLSEKEIKLSPIPTSGYPTKASRPSYSVLDKTKIKEQLSIPIPHWKESLKQCLQNLNN